jgi:hypothetical protein
MDPADWFPTCYLNEKPKTNAAAIKASMIGSMVRIVFRGKRGFPAL